MVHLGRRGFRPDFGVALLPVVLGGVAAVPSALFDDASRTA